MTALAIAGVQEIPAGKRGFDINQPITKLTAPLWKAHGYTYVDRYIWRLVAHDNDLSPAEVEAILSGGLGLMVSQHYEGDGWIPSAQKGATYGGNAVKACRSLALPMGLTVSLDLEGIDINVPAAIVDAYARAWYEAVTDGGYLAQLYFGWHCILTGPQLHALPFTRYRSAYNANGEQYPKPRGACVKQRSAILEDIPAGAGVKPFEIDLDLVTGDAEGGLPTALMPGEGMVA